MRLLRNLIRRNPSRNPKRGAVRRRKSKISRYKRALAELEAIPAFERQRPEF